METKIFDIKLPTSWAELSDKQLLLIFNLFARDLSAAEVKTLCLMKWNRLKVLASLPGHRFIIKKKGEHEVTLSARQVQQATSVLNFLDAFAPVPVRIARIGRHKAIAADFHLKLPLCVHAAIEQYKADNDWMAHFLEACCVVEDGREEKSGELYTAYRAYCARSGEYTRNSAEFYSALDQRGFRKIRRSGGRFITGLSLSDFNE